MGATGAAVPAEVPAAGTPAAGAPAAGVVAAGADGVMTVVTGTTTGVVKGPLVTVTV